MAYCPKSHWYDENKHASCNICASIGGGQAGAAPPTQYEETGLPPVRPYPGLQPVSPVYAAPMMGPDGVPFTPGGKTRCDSDDARLKGFLVITESRLAEDEWRYFRISKGVTRIGRFGSRASVELRDTEVSLDHALIVATNRAVRLIDLDSSNGLFIDGNKAEIALLDQGTEIQIGRTKMRFVPFDWVAEE